MSTHDEFVHLQVIVPGQHVYLGPIRRDLAPVYQRWMNDLEVSRTLTAHWRVPFTVEDEIEWFEQARRDPTRRVFTIYERSTWRPIGNTGLHQIDHRHGTAEFGIMIGEADARGRGYGTEATRLMLDYAFTVLGLHNVMLRVYAYNLPAHRAYSKAGFREFGRRREAVRMGGRWWDVIYMECLASEFTGSTLAPIFSPDAPRDRRE